MSREPATEHWAGIYRTDGRDLYRITDRKRFVRLMRRRPLAFVLSTGAIARGSLVLEVGCGGGQYGIACALAGCRTVLMDYSREVLETAEANVEMAKTIDPSLETKTVQSDMFRLGFSDSCFDLTFNEGALEHLASSADRVRCMRELVRVTKPGGQVLIMIPNHVHPLVSYWRRRGFPWLEESNPLREQVISPATLGAEMEAAGLSAVYLDGYEVYDTLQKWPRTPGRVFAARVLKTLLPEPTRRLRLKYGTYLFGLGQV